MNDGYSGMDAEQSTDDAGPKVKDDAPKDTEESNEVSEGLLSKSFFQGHECKPGDTYQISVVQTYDDEVQVRLKSGDKG